MRTHIVSIHTPLEKCILITEKKFWTRLWNREREIRRHNCDLEVFRQGLEQTDWSTYLKAGGKRITKSWCLQRARAFRNRFRTYKGQKMPLCSTGTWRLEDTIKQKGPGVGGWKRSLRTLKQENLKWNFYTLVTSAQCLSLSANLERQWRAGRDVISSLTPGLPRHPTSNQVNWSGNFVDFQPLII